MRICPMKKLLQKDDILNLLPELHLIGDETLCEKCIDTLLAASVAGGWTQASVSELPVSLTKVKRRQLNNQFDHLRAVTKIALGMVESLADLYADKVIKRDIIIAGALLHDVGKFMEFVLDNEIVRYADNAKLMRHPLSGAILAAQHDLPDEIVHIIAVHSFEGKESYESLESIIVKMADEVAFKYIASFNS